MMDWQIMDSLRHGLPMDMDVIDATKWSCNTALREWSNANISAPIDITDLTVFLGKRISLEN